MTQYDWQKQRNKSSEPSPDDLDIGSGFWDYQRFSRREIFWWKVGYTVFFIALAMGFVFLLAVGA